MITLVNQLVAWVRMLASWLSVIGGAILIFSMLAVLADVVTRTIFGATGGAINLTFRGSYEIVRYGLLLSILYALPNALKDGQVFVEIFTEKLPQRAKNILSGIFVFFFGVFGFLLTTGLIERIENAAMTGETTQDLGLPIGHIYYFALIGTVMLGIRGITVSWEYFTATVEDNA
ncbi:MAG: TRAP transporter small permease subunit [Saccharospirillum sp.]